MAGWLVEIVKTWMCWESEKSGKLAVDFVSFGYMNERIRLLPSFEFSVLHARLW